MAQYASQSDRELSGSMVSSVANPIPLGLGALAFTTAVLGCVYAGFIIPSARSNISIVSIVVGAALFYGGIVQILAGMWEFRKDNTIAATVFSSYGGFLAALGAIFIPGLGIFGALTQTKVMPQALGLFFLCWTIFTGVLFLASLRTSVAFLIVLGLLFLSYLLLTIGELAGGNVGALIIGGWLGIITALVAWYTALAGMLDSAHGVFRLPMGQIG